MSVSWSGTRLEFVILDGEALNLVAHGTDLAGQLAGVVAGDAGSNDGAADTAGTAEVHLAAHVDVGDLHIVVSTRTLSFSLS